MPSLLAIVILHFPERPLEEIISSFKNDVDEVMIIDNTVNNAGVAAALNNGLQYALEKKYDWVLTMDQDSTFEAGALCELKKFAFTCNDNIAIVSPFHFIKTTPKKTSIEEVKITMTSGNLLRVSSYKTA